MSSRPTRAAGVPPAANRLAAVLATGLRVRPVARTGVVYSTEPPDVDVVAYLGEEDEEDPDYISRDNPRWGNDFQWVVQRVRESPFYFVLASNEFRRSRELAIVTLNGSGDLLRYMSPAFKNDRTLVKLALKDFGEAFEFASDELKHDDDVIRAAFAGPGGAFVFNLLPEELKQNRDYMRIVVKLYIHAFDWFPIEAQRDRQFVLQLLELQPDITALSSVRELYKDEDFWVAAVRARTHNYAFIPETTAKTRAFLLKLTHANGDVLAELIKHNDEWFLVFKSTDDRTDWKMDLKALYENDPEFRIAMATAETNRNTAMVSAILHDVEAAIKMLMKERLLVETDAVKRARLERLAGYETLLGTLAASGLEPGGDFELKIEELVALLNDPQRSPDFYEYRVKQAMDDIQMVDEERAQKRKRETDAFAAGAALPRLPVLAEYSPPEFVTDAPKRAIEPSAEKSQPKRFLAGNAYNEIFQNVVRTFGPRVFVCEQREPQHYDFEFYGRDRHKKPCWVTLRFLLKTNILTASRTFLFSFRVADRYGLVENIADLFDAGTPPIANIPCGLTATDVEKRMRVIFEGWLDFASSNYTL